MLCVSIELNIIVVNFSKTFILSLLIHIILSQIGDRPFWYRVYGMGYWLMWECCSYYANLLSTWIEKFKQKKKTYLKWLMENRPILCQNFWVAFGCECSPKTIKILTIVFWMISLWFYLIPLFNSSDTIGEPPVADFLECISEVGQSRRALTGLFVPAPILKWASKNIETSYNNVLNYLTLIT